MSRRPPARIVELARSPVERAVGDLKQAAGLLERVGAGREDERRIVTVAPTR